MSGEGTHNVYDDTQLLADISDLQDSVDDLDADVVLLQADVDAIAVLVEAEAILEETGGTLTTDGTLQTIYINNAPAGVYEPRVLKIHFANQTAAESVRLLVNYRIAPGGPWVIDDREPIVGIPVNAGIKIQLEPTRYGIWITIEKTVGTNRAYDWEILYEV